MAAPLKFVAVHLGAGNGPQKDNPTIVNFAKYACESVMSQECKALDTRVRCCNQYCQTSIGDQLQNQKVGPNHMTAREGVVQLIKILEDYQPLNCGYGSNLNMRGEVECDASLMSDNDMIWTGVGGVSGCKNPIMLAKSIYDHTMLKRPLNLVQPNILAGSGAKEWMRKHCPEICIADSKLITTKSLDSYQKYKSRYDLESRANETANANKSVISGSEIYEPMLDTVGAVAIDHSCNVATAVSSGGIILKHKGRLGQAAIPGAGCWADNGVAVNSTGVGEYLILSMFARKVHETLVKDLNRNLNDLGSGDYCNNISGNLVCCFEDLAEASYLAHVPKKQRFAGFLSVHSDHIPGKKGKHNYLSYGHNTDSLCIGYMSSSDNRAHSLESRLGEDELAEVKTIRV